MGIDDLLSQLQSNANVTASVRDISQVHLLPDAKARSDLARLVARVLNAGGWDEAEIDEAIRLALDNFDDALRCYKDLAQQMGLTTQDDRCMCFECVEYQGGGCMAAHEGEFPSDKENYKPLRYLPRNCEQFKKY